MHQEEKSATVITPHLGEMARVTGRPIKTIEEDRISHLRETAEDLHAVVVLKGAHSLTGYPDGRISMTLSGNPGMATAGSGDVLTGTIAAMHGLGLNLHDAVRTGVFVHGRQGTSQHQPMEKMASRPGTSSRACPGPCCCIRQGSLAQRYVLPEV